MSAPQHSPIDQALVDRAVQLGALAPTFTRYSNPSLWRCWDDRACLLSAIARGGHGDVAAARAECDRYSGHVMPVPRPPEPSKPRQSATSSLDALDFLALGMERFLKGATT